MLAFAGVAFLGSAARGHVTWARQESVAAARVYERFCEVLQRAAKRPRRIYETPREYFEAVRVGLGPLASDAGAISGSFEAMFYGVPGSGSPVPDLERRVNELAKQARKLPKKA